MAKDVVPEEARRRRRPTRRGTVLSEKLIVETALRMVREHGSAGLSARRLGAALGADPSTLYRYFEGMDGLTLAIGEELIGRALAGWSPTGRWRDDLRALGLRIHGAYLAHPQAALLTASRVTGRPREIAADEAVLGILRGAGFGDEAAVRIYHAYIDQSLAFAALDAGPWPCRPRRASRTRSAGSRRTPACRRTRTRTSRPPPGCWPPGCRTAPTRSRWRCCWTRRSGSWPTPPADRGPGRPGLCQHH